MILELPAGWPYSSSSIVNCVAYDVSLKLIKAFDSMIWIIGFPFSINRKLGVRLHCANDGSTFPYFIFFFWTYSLFIQFNLRTDNIENWNASTSMLLMLLLSSTHPLCNAIALDKSRKIPVKFKVFTHVQCRWNQRFPSIQSNFDFESFVLLFLFNKNRDNKKKIVNKKWTKQ